MREPFNAVSHWAGALAALPASAVLVASGGPGKGLFFAVYGLSLVCLFVVSGSYHAVHATGKNLARWRALDHAAIYFLIAGTYTPFCGIAFSGFWSWGLLAIIWVFAAVGIGTTIFVAKMPRWLSAGIYLAMGWLGIAAGGQFLSALSRWTLGWLLAGGLLYSVGAFIYATKKGGLFSGRLGFHELWHLFVLAAATAHFVAVASLA